jgi:hypothetical protein
MMFMMDQVDCRTALLKPLETALVPASTEPVIIRNHFKKNTGVQFSTIFVDFQKRFFDKTEAPSEELAYRKYKLLCTSADGPIIAELGGGSKVEGTFAAAFALLQRQPRGQAGFLQTGGYANIFYVRDKKKELCAVRIGWASDGWVVDSIPAADPLAWHGEHLIFCPLAAAWDL